jgi:hypothetical protein
VAGAATRVMPPFTKPKVRPKRLRKNSTNATGRRTVSTEVEKALDNGQGSGDVLGFFDIGEGGEKGDGFNTSKAFEIDLEDDDGTVVVVDCRDLGGD